MGGVDVASVVFDKDVVSSHHQLEGQAALVGEGQLFCLKVENQNEDLWKM